MRFVSYRLGVLLAFVLQVGLLAWLIADRAMLLRSGQEIRLTVVPIDPHDLFRGDYVTLNYAISTLDTQALAGDDVFEIGKPIYVSLSNDSGDWKATSLSVNPPAAGTYITGTVRDTSNGAGCASASGCPIYFVDYNLEKFFVPEGTGRELENLRSEQRVSVDVAVGSGGRAALKRLLVDGTPRYEENLF